MTSHDEPAGSRGRRQLREGGRYQPPAGRTDAFLERVRMVGVDFSRSRLSDFTARDSEFVRCDFSRASFGHAFLGIPAGYRMSTERVPTTVYRECDFTRTRLPSLVQFGNARFENCIFDGTFVRMTYTQEAQFVDCTFRGKVKATFWGRPWDRHQEALGRDHNDFTGNDFAAAQLTGYAFHHIDLRAQRFPGPPDYLLLDRIGPRVKAVLAAVASWPDDRRKEARWHLLYHASEAIRYTGGHALVSREWMGKRLPPEARDELFHLLATGADPA